MPDPQPCPFCGATLELDHFTTGDSMHRHPRNDCVLANTGLGDPLSIFDYPEEVARWDRRAARGVGACAGQPISPPDADGSATKEKQHGN